MPEKWGKPCHMHAVRCPSCGKPNDFREVADGLAGDDMGEDEKEFTETRSRPTVECDHCKAIMEVVKIQPTTLIWVRKWDGSGKNHHTFEAGQVTYRCSNADCKAEFYDRMPETDFQGQPIGIGCCPNCQHALSQV